MKQTLLVLRDCLPVWRVAFCLSLIAILWLATTSSPYPVPSSSSDKVNHIIAFLELTLLARLSWPGVGLHRYLLPLLCFGLALEVIQSQLAHREFAWADLLADMVGIGIGLLPWPLIPGVHQAAARDT